MHPFLNAATNIQSLGQLIGLTHVGIGQMLIGGGLGGLLMVLNFKESTEKSHKQKVDKAYDKHQTKVKEEVLKPIEESKGIALFENADCKDTTYTDFFRSLNLIKLGEWVSLVEYKEEKAYKLFKFKLCSTISTETFKKQVDVIGEKIGVKELNKNRLDIFLKEGLMQFRIANEEIPPMDYKGLKPPTVKHLLIGHDFDYKALWMDAPNLLITGTTGSGKTTKFHVILNNFLANKQGTLYIANLKGDYNFYKGKEGVVMVVDDLNDVKKLVAAYEEEYNRRVKLLGETYKDVDDYNKRNPEGDILKPMMLVIDEYADISDVYTDKSKRPIGVYADIIRLARKHRYLMGKMLLGTQRASVDVIIGTLKNSFSIIGMTCLNKRNSEISIDQGGCENLKEREALGYLNNELTHIFSYRLTDVQLLSNIKKLKDK